MCRGKAVSSVMLALPNIKIAATSDECIEWGGARDGAGYGVLYLNNKQLKAHRVFWQWANQTTIPKGMVVMHSCDNPPCVNPRHLSVGSYRDNVTDCNSKGRRRQVRRDTHGMAKLTEAQVAIIKLEYRPRAVPLRVFAERFGVSESTIHDVVTGRHWC